MYSIVDRAFDQPLTTAAAASMSSLADELLNDLDDTGEDEVEHEEQAAGPSGLGRPLKRKAEEDADMEEDDDGEDEEQPTIEGGVAPGGIAPAQGKRNHLTPASFNH